MIKRYRKKPVIVEAILFTGQNYQEVWDFGCKMYIDSVAYEDKSRFEHYAIQTLEGFMIVRKGDYIIKGVQGEFYPCKPDIFEQTYEEVHHE